MIDRIFTFLQLFFAGFFLGALLTGLFGNNVPLEIFGGTLAAVGVVVLCRKNWLTKSARVSKEAA